MRTERRKRRSEWIAIVLLWVAVWASAQEPNDSITPRPGIDGSQRMSSLPIRKPAELRDTVTVTVRDTVWMECPEEADTVAATFPIETARNDRRGSGYRRGWNALIPTHAKLQYAGNMGLLSVGIGWEYGKHKQWETEILFGYLPKYESDRHKFTFTLKENYIPWRLRLKEKPVSIEPLLCGLYFNSIFGDEFWIKEPDRYPSGYYGFSSRIRINIFLGQAVTLYLPERKHWTPRHISLFYEVSSCDLYIISAFTNKYLRPRDYLCLSLGLRMQIL